MQSFNSSFEAVIMELTTPVMLSKYSVSLFFTIIQSLSPKNGYSQAQITEWLAKNKIVPIIELILDFLNTVKFVL